MIKFLPERGLAFRGDNKLLSTQWEFLRLFGGHFCVCSFFAEHISKYGQKGRGMVSYLSSTMCEDLIRQMGEKVLCPGPVTF